MKLISLNIEGQRHHKTVFPFLEREKADVICLQEVTGSQVQFFLKSLGYSTTFLPLCLKEQDGLKLIKGHVIATKAPHAAVHHYYCKHSDTLSFDSYDAQKDKSNSWRGITLCTFEQAGEVFNVATTHFTWSPDGDTASVAQKQDMSALLDYTQTLQPHILCGDFNIPRNLNELYDTLTMTYTDAIPKKYKYSLDPDLHRLSSIPRKEHLSTRYMVDYIFTQPPYRAKNVRLEFGISDHAAVIADIYTVE